jgi:bacteriocin-like protein
MDTIEHTEIELTDEQLEQVTGGFDQDNHQNQQQHEPSHPQQHHGHWILWHHKRVWHWDN